MITPTQINLATFDPLTASDVDALDAQEDLAEAGFYKGDLDSVFGPLSRAALAAWRAANPTAFDSTQWHSVMASSFADPADVAAFRRHKALGDSDQQAFKFGDNGIGYWGDDCSQGSGPRCALPPEVWKALAHPHLARVEVMVNGRTVVCELADTMPHEENITNGAGLDMNPDLCAALAVHPPVMVSATWRWAA